jgi:hypothetical protein
MDMDNKMERIVAAYDFDSRRGSWFDMWHTHVDWHGKGTDDATVREHFLLEAIRSYDTFCGKMEDRGLPYQAWILVDLQDSSEDAIYVHSPDPHGDSPFPFSIGLAQSEPAADDPISQVFIERGFVRYLQPDHDDMYFFARPGIGQPLS